MGGKMILAIFTLCFCSFCFAKKYECYSLGGDGDWLLRVDSVLGRAAFFDGKIWIGAQLVERLGHELYFVGVINRARFEKSSFLIQFNTDSVSGHLTVNANTDFAQNYLPQLGCEVVNDTEASYR